MSTNKAKGFFEEFKTFAMRGNVIDMAVGVVIGGAFGKITTSIVNDHSYTYKSNSSGHWKECVQCGEKFYSDEVSKKLEEIYETAKKMDASIVEADYEKGPKSLRKVS